MKTGFSLCRISHREKPVFITWEPCNENRFFTAWKYYTGKTLYWPCTGLQCMIQRAPQTAPCWLSCRLPPAGCSKGIKFTNLLPYPFVNAMRYQKCFERQYIDRILFMVPIFLKPYHCVQSVQPPK